VYEGLGGMVEMLSSIDLVKGVPSAASGMNKVGEGLGGTVEMLSSTDHVAKGSCVP
jgi:hypothetical protein